MATQGHAEPRRLAASARNSARTLALAVLTTYALLATPSTGAPPAAKADVRLPRDVSLKVTVRPSVLSRSKRAPFIDDDAINKLIHYGYLPESYRQTGNESQLTDAIRQFQRNAHIPATGVVDELTRRQFAKPRCGLPDVQPRGRDKSYRRRHKPAAPPDACDTHYDAISVIRGETFIFSGQYFWRTNGTHKPVPVKISKFWYGLPENLTKIDAIYQRPHDHKIVIFIGRQFWVYNSNTPEVGYPQPLTALGLPESLDGLDAAMVWGHNGKTYLFRNDMYWRFDEAVGQVELDYPRDISVWHGVPYKLDAAFQYGGLLYFFKGRDFWRFDDRLMRVRSPVPSSSAVKWMGCPLTTARVE
ncbi:matrix metalloproteinase-17-like [Amphibalanus amphitrite]|uniref:matrix metalloproteinase-17-like n=1 Tax=Amphibalanus amphitrite TaxID=1232801 RepID=UPI001C8FCDBB|nr:matrix metalloproteinase-17-like [Amphibalanus amphitrite]